MITGSYGPEDATRASFPFHIAKGAKEAGHIVSIALAAEAPVLVKDLVREKVVGVGIPPLVELFQFAVEHKIPIYV